MDFQTAILSLAFLIVAVVYAAVGHAGASGYIALMGFAGFAPLAMKTTALALNLVVAAIGTAFFLSAAFRGGMSGRSPCWGFHSRCSEAQSTFRSASIFPWSEQS